MLHELQLYVSAVHVVDVVAATVTVAIAVTITVTVTVKHSDSVCRVWSPLNTV
jgi:hypothetical protein